MITCIYLDPCRDAGVLGSVRSVYDRFSDHCAVYVVQRFFRHFAVITHHIPGVTFQEVVAHSMNADDISDQFTGRLYG